jgi:hypothetical protein
MLIENAFKSCCACCVTKAVAASTSARSIVSRYRLAEILPPAVQSISTAKFILSRDRNKSVLRPGGDPRSGSVGSAHRIPRQECTSSPLARTKSRSSCGPEDEGEPIMLKVVPSVSRNASASPPTKVKYGMKIRKRPRLSGRSPSLGPNHLSRESARVLQSASRATSAARFSSSASGANLSASSPLASSPRSAD